ncbi:MAG: hypothetical protein AAF571_15305, partial [Verrucomicrobiota bacterium]
MREFLAIATSRMMANKLGYALVILCAGCSNTENVESYTADQVLNGTFHGRKSSPEIEVLHDVQGFAQERLYTVPEPGVHPRILFGPDDLPRIREQFRTSTHAAELLGQLRQKVEKDFSGPAGWEDEVFAAMAAGDMDQFIELWEDPRNPRHSGPPGSGAHPFLSALMDKAFLSLMDDDQVSGQKVAAAVATYATFLQARVEEAATQPGQENYWLSVRGVMGD